MFAELPQRKLGRGTGDFYNLLDQSSTRCSRGAQFVYSLDSRFGNSITIFPYNHSIFVSMALINRSEVISPLCFFRCCETIQVKLFFSRGVQATWSTRRFQVISWRQLQQLFEIISGQSFEKFFKQWITLPDISIRTVKRGKPAFPAHIV